MTINEKKQLSNIKSNENLNLSLVSQTPSNKIYPSNSKINSFSQILNKNPCSLNNTLTPQLFEMDLFTNTDRKYLTGTSHIENIKGFNISQVQKLKIDLAEKQRKDTKSRSNSLVRNASTDGSRKNLNFRKKTSIEGPKNTTGKKVQPLCSYVSLFLFFINEIFY